ncbi:GNAT family N-acetyltransferase [Halarcobacter sp.]|uniref:GNAT family N-acetyltransferase n=1 Tax=Halarcobacter sp. TaxID=2321133 RepID=UPI002AAACE58|nr:GNAT family N-acetyltransferase [Halarcobacter sp.]
MEVLKYSQEYQLQYEEFIKNDNRNLFFHSINYLNLLCELLNANNETIIVKENDQIVGVLPLLSKKGLYGTVINSSPYYGSNGYIITENDEVYNILLEEYNNLILNTDIFASVLITNPLREIEITNLNYNYEDYRIGQFTFLPKDVESLMDLFHSKTRNMVRKAFKSNIEIEVDNNAFEFLENTHKENMLEIGGTAKSEKFFHLVRKYFKADMDYKIYVAKIDGKQVSALLLFYFNDTIEYFTPVVKVEYRNIQPLSAIIYDAMIDGIKNNYKKWNWGGTWSSQEGVYRFKKRWGTEDIRYNYYIQVNKNKTDLRKEVLLNEYSGFYTIPFSEL